MNMEETLRDYTQNMDYISLILICAPVVVVIICGLYFFKSKNDTMQRNSSKASHTLSSTQNCKNYTLDSDITISCNYRKSASSSRKAHKLRSANKHSDKQVRSKSKGFATKDWLQDDLYCYNREFISSCVEDNMSNHKLSNHNNRSSQVTGTDDINSSSSNEEIFPIYSINKTSTFGNKSKQKKQQKRKQHTNTQTMNLHEENKENMKPFEAKESLNSGALNLRKQCTKAAAFKTVLNNNKISKNCINILGTSEYNLSSQNSIYFSYVSSTASTNSSVSSSASSSPINSLNSSPTASPIAYKRNSEYWNKSWTFNTPPLRQFKKLNMNEKQLAHVMSRFILDPNLLRLYGFPVLSEYYKNCVEIYKCLPKHLAEEAVTKDNQRHHRNFYGRKLGFIKNISSPYRQQQSYANISVDSGHYSDDSSPRYNDSDSSELGEDDLIIPLMTFYTPDNVYQIFSEYSNYLEKQCVRCSKIFQVDNEGVYHSFDSCSYHWGKANTVYNGKYYVNMYSCCQREENSEGCCKNALHVWNGVVFGANGPYTDFVFTQEKKGKHNMHPKIYAIDCEMSYTGLGLEVTKVTVVAYDGSLVYEHFVMPRSKIIDYNTRFSGVSENDFRSNNYIKTFTEVQNDLLNLFDADTILVGHGLDNDLRVLRLMHTKVVDTSLIFTHSTGFPYKRSLRNLTKSFLKRDIQCGNNGHSSFEDSRACLELMMWKIRKDLRHWSSHQE